MNLSYSQIKTHILKVTNENWTSHLTKPNHERDNYREEQQTLHIGQIVARFLGVPLDEDEYYNRLFDLIHTENAGLILLSEEHLDKTINNQQFQAIQKVLNINREQDLSINRFAAFLDGEQLLLKSSSPSMHRKIREAMISMLKLFSELEPAGLKNQEIRRVLVDVIKWSTNHLGTELKDIDPKMAMPKILWYGNGKKSHFYFLYYLIQIGCDILYFSPSGEDLPAKMGPVVQESFAHHYPEKKRPEPFPQEKRRRSATVAYRASREIETILNHEGSGLYKPWQLRDYTPSSVTLKTTYDELFILIKEKAMIRPNFEVKEGRVMIPSVFSKIQGVSRNRKEYWDRIQTISQYDESLLIRRFPFTNSVNNDFRFHYRNALDREGKLDPEKIIAGHYWRYQQLPGGLQNGIAMAIRNMCERPRIKPLSSESEEELKIYLFSQSLQIPPSILKLMQQFDYSQDVPKIILYNNELNGTMVRSDAALLLLLNQFGLDIVLYNPPGHNDIENFIEEDLYDVHWLEDVVFEQEFKEPSFLKKVLFQGLLKNLKGD
ncbi:YceG-like Ter operon protein [Cytobacillus firmus]|uniref:YceG-like Ter operon protein n=2 Tax=Cytobacillus TaxID=2675230 RepID=A0A366JQQ2_CYTFI|nr:YceG-like Ter operon protein [Cytobacillus firmus]TDX47043.1 YceG-like Ter operon protein [Cytobacillus oceanisediminis]